MSDSTKPALKLLLATPRGFCAGVDRAVLIVERALEIYGPPVYVRHEIVHNKRVVDDLAAKGAVFVEELSDLPDSLDEKTPVIFSAHGVPKAVTSEADRLELNWLDATCPLVSKVHIEAQQHFSKGYEILMIGHAGHPEVIGTMGQLPAGTIRLIENTEDAETIEVSDPSRLAYISQTTLSVDDTAAIVATLKSRFPDIAEPHKQDICYATTNRQAAVKDIAPLSDMVLVIGAPNSSNSMRLVEVSLTSGCPEAYLITGREDIQPDRLKDISTLGLTAGASAPENLMDEVIEELSTHFSLAIEEVVHTTESVEFKLPKQIR
ncbi:4-hydroxy-3-methylbut-2-enyl diphosphate reductase [alpha proteobacterium IMCC14465]|uniref:4-hydroxy-3-methylbut-2-enyl diphosphate reductase n=1 Tax=alpha proteobacterium IMCC14465 TaxID=1220535 RepID=J9DHK1_9PROT|nr:4-hydroxy-3-methylbut-2-enyl diphosphate reductase [alpha proteobacterium IMCC14465]